VIGVAGVGVGGASGSPEGVAFAATLAVEFFLLGRCNNVSNVREDAS
jgi:hypothetical protein